jgi:Protein of unknown function (DUF2878)
MKQRAPNSTAFKLWTFVAYEACWFACILGAAHGFPWVGPVAVAVCAAVHLAWMQDRLREAAWLVWCGLFGFGADSLLGYLGVLSFPHPSWIPWLSPPWLVSMWICFAFTFHGCVDWLLGRYVLGAVLGALGGPLAYWAGERMGAVVFGRDLETSLVAIGVLWLVATPILLVFARLTQVPADRAASP